MPERNLPVFDGDPLHYFGFMKRFEEIVLKQISEPALQLEYLINIHQIVCLCGSELVWGSSQIVAVSVDCLFPVVSSLWFCVWF